MPRNDKKLDFKNLFLKISTYLEEELGKERLYILVDVQRLDRHIDDSAEKAIATADAVRRWKECKEGISDFPINMLNISDNRPGHWPESIYRYYNPLNEAIASAERDVYDSFTLIYRPL